MKSKSFNLDHLAADTMKQNRTFDFVNLYNPAAETSTSRSENKNKSIDNNGAGNLKFKSESPKRERSPHKRKKKREPIDISHITIDGPSQNSRLGGSTHVNEFKATSTPLGNRKTQGSSSKGKSIMKNSATATEFRDDTMDGSKLDYSSKSKKRNKSVSFMLEDYDQVVVKKTRSDDSMSETKSDAGSPKLNVNKAKRQFKKVKKNRQAEKENKLEENQTMDTNEQMKDKSGTISEIKLDIQKVPTKPVDQCNQSENVIENKKRRKKAKKLKKPDESTEIKDNTSTCNEAPQKSKKRKKKKHPEKHEQDNEEPASQTRKKDSKPDVIAELENLSIGDNPHTLTNLLDEMTVVDKENRKKLKQQFNKNKKPKGAAKETASEKTAEVEEKVKWRRRKWNKDFKPDEKEVSLDTTIIVENLPVQLLLSYKKVLAEHFVKYGMIKTVGIAEMYSTKVLWPVFTTTINFYSDGAATEALQEDNTILEGQQIQVKRPLSLYETTLVLRSYGAITDQYISSTFNSAGPIRNIRHLLKGKNSIGTFFIEFDGPESVERAMKLGANVKLGGKKIYLSKYELRTKKIKQEKTMDNPASDADQSDDSQN